jgi:inosine triphosphate pyrophosphatase
MNEEKAVFLPRMKSITFVTGNEQKLKEVKEILLFRDDLYRNENNNNRSSSGFDLISKSIDLPELQGSSQEVIAKQKCLMALREIKGPCLVEDTSLCFEGLRGLPGPYIKWFLEKLGLDGLVKMLSAYDDKRARAMCVFAYAKGVECTDVDDIECFVGITEGVIVEKRGKEEFGWDAIFEPTEQTDFDNRKTYGEMEKEEKNRISHRYRALEKLRKRLEEEDE